VFFGEARRAQRLLDEVVEVFGLEILAVIGFGVFEKLAGDSDSFPAEVLFAAKDSGEFGRHLRHVDQLVLETICIGTAGDKGVEMEEHGNVSVVIDGRNSSEPLVPVENRKLPGSRLLARASLLTRRSVSLAFAIFGTGKTLPV